MQITSIIVRFRAFSLALLIVSDIYIILSSQGGAQTILQKIHIHGSVLCDAEAISRVFDPGARQKQTCSVQQQNADLTVAIYGNGLMILGDNSKPAGAVWPFYAATQVFHEPDGTPHASISTITRNGNIYTVDVDDRMCGLHMANNTTKWEPEPNNCKTPTPSDIVVPGFLFQDFHIKFTIIAESTCLVSNFSSAELDVTPLASRATSVSAPHLQCEILR